MHGIRPIIFAASILVGLLANRWLGVLESWGSHLARRKRTVILCAAIVPIAARLLLLPWDPVPIPSIHDEVSYLLAADTFAHGRLTNPPHSQWVFLDTFHVLQRPTYASIYPPAQGMALAVGQLLGHPWIGVLLSMAAMSAAITWAMQGWLPARWALLGSVLAILRLNVMSYWVDGYWGGAVAATGGALVIGTLPRILRRPNTRDSLLMAVGAALLANSRPVEGLLFCIPVALLLGVRIVSDAGAELREKAVAVLLPALLVLAAVAVFMGYYNFRVTGSALLFPHFLYHRLYWRFPLFLWQHAPAPIKYDNPQFTAFFIDWNRSEILNHSFLRLCLTKCHDGWIFFLGPLFTIPFITLPWLLFDRRIRFLMFQFLWCGIWILQVAWFAPHYAAALTVSTYIILTQAFRHLRQWKFKQWPVGVITSRVIVVIALVTAFIPGSEAFYSPRRGWNLKRAEIVEQLNATPGKHLVLVHYEPDHDVLHEWVYNAADIDGSKVVWARDIPGRDLTPLLAYFHDRKIWVVAADANPPHLQPYKQGSSPVASR